MHALVDTADHIDVDMTAPRTPMDQVPDYVLEFCLPSRYCQSDMLGTFAWGVVGDALPGYPQVEAIRSWIAGSMRYEYNVSTVSTSVLETLQHRAGVCRDFAHLGIAMCRAIEIPARMVVGYLHELDPMDQHAWWEAYVGGRWFTFDATQLFPKGNRVAVGYGRDAADVALATQYGSLELTEMSVFVSAASRMSRHADSGSRRPRIVGKNSATVGWIGSISARTRHGASACISALTIWTISSPVIPSVAAPRNRSVSASTSSLMRPSVSPSSFARVRSFIGNVAFSTLRPDSPALRARSCRPGRAGDR